MAGEAVGGYQFCTSSCVFAQAAGNHIEVIRNPIGIARPVKVKRTVMESLSVNFQGDAAAHIIAINQVFVAFVRVAGTLGRGFEVVGAGDGVLAETRRMGEQKNGRQQEQCSAKSHGMGGVGIRVVRCV